MTELATSDQLARQADRDDQVIALRVKARSPATIRAYTQDVNRFRAAVGRPLHPVRLLHLQD